MKISESKVRQLVREEAKKVMNERSESTWNSIAGRFGSPIVGKTISNVSIGGDMIDINFEDGTSISFAVQDMIVSMRGFE